jgi:hypothetical protein
VWAAGFGLEREGGKKRRANDMQLHASVIQSFTTRSPRMDRSLASKIQAANSALIANGNMDAVGEFFTPDYVAHLTDQDMTGGHDAIRRVLDDGAMR